MSATSTAESTIDAAIAALAGADHCNGLDMLENEMRRVILGERSRLAPPRAHTRN